MRLLIAAFTMLSFIAMPAKADEWYVLETANFIVKTYDDEEDAIKFTSELERFDMALRFMQGLPRGEEQETPSTKLTIYRYGDIGDLQRITGLGRIAGVYFGRAGDNIAYTPAKAERRRSMSVTDPDRRRNEIQRLDEVMVLQHEYVHYFMLQNFPTAYPSWYIEGFAELMATTRFNDDGSFHIGDPPQYRAFNIFRMRQFQLEDMLNAEHDLSGREAFQFYGTGWLFAHYLNFNPERRAQLDNYLVAVANGENSLEAGRRIFGDLEAINKDLLSYRNGPFPGFTAKPGDYVEPKVSIRPMTAVEEAHALDEMRLAHGRYSEEKAKEKIADLKSSEFANSPEVLELIVRAYLRADDPNGMYEAAQRLMEANENVIEGPLYASYATAELAEEDDTWLPKSVQYATQAYAIDPLDPRPAIAFYGAYVSAKKEAPENAVIALESAYDFAGSDIVYRVLLARQLLVENRIGSAQTVLQAAAFQGHNQGPNEDEDEDDRSKRPPNLNEIMTEIRASNRDSALTMIDELLFWEDPEDA